MGVARAGFEHAALIEFNKSACKSIRLNQMTRHKLLAHSPLHEMDVRDFSYEGIGGVQLVAGGPPCQPFSIGGKHKGHRDERDMFPEAVRAVRCLRPPAFVFENVKGLLRRSFATYFQYITLQLRHPEVVRNPGEEWESHCRRLERQHTRGTEDGLRYNVVWGLVNAADYGVPQRRERVILVGFRSDLGVAWSFPKPTHSQLALGDAKRDGSYWDRHRVPKREREVANTVLPPMTDNCLPWRTVRDAIGDLPDPESRAAQSIANHVFVPGARSYPGHTGSPLDEPAKTLKAGDHGVPGGENTLRRRDSSVRYFTVREAARLQTFPDDYIWNESWTETMRQLGNAVPVMLAETIISSVAKTLVARC